MTRVFFLFSIWLQKKKTRAESLGSQYSTVARPDVKDSKQMTWPIRSTWTSQNGGGRKSSVHDHETVSWQQCEAVNADRCSEHRGKSTMRAAEFAKSWL